jgi:hypothetical protein
MKQVRVCSLETETRAEFIIQIWPVSVSAKHSNGTIRAGLYAVNNLHIKMQNVAIN